MEHILQCHALRRPLTYAKYSPTWDISDLDGGCRAWREFQERQLLPRRLPPRLKIVYRKDVEQFQKTLEKEAMAKRWWDQRARDNADREGWWLEARFANSSEMIEDDIDDKDEYSIVYDPLEKERQPLNVESDKNVSAAKDDAAEQKDDKNKYVIVDNNDDDEDEDEHEDEHSTIYSCARHNPPASQEVFSENLMSSSTTSVDSYVTAPCTLQSTSLVYHSFAKDQLAFRDFLTQHVHRAWRQYETERQNAIIDKNRTLDVKRTHGGVLSICNWKCLPLSETYKDCEEYALKRPTVGACAYYRTPIIIVTNEDGEHFRLLEVKKILTEEQIAAVRRERDAVQKQRQEYADLYDLRNFAGLEGQTPAERRAVNAAKAWWSVEQKKRDATYIDWEHAEDQEVELLKRQIEQEVDLHFKNKEQSRAKWRMRERGRQATAAQIQHLANLKLNLFNDKLDYIGSGRYIGSEYDVTFDFKALSTFLMYRDDIDAMAYAIQRNANTAETKAEAKRGREELRQKQCDRACTDKMMRAVKRREIEILSRYAHRKRQDWMLGEGEEWKAPILNWVENV